MPFWGRLDLFELLFDTGRVEYVSRRRGRPVARAPSTRPAPRVPEHTFGQPVPVVVRIVWDHDCEEHIATLALGWTGQHACIRLPDPRCRCVGDDVRRCRRPVNLLGQGLALHAMPARRMT
jgi:hypothetical protein